MKTHNAHTFIAKAKRNEAQHKTSNVLPVFKCDSQEFTLLCSLLYISRAGYHSFGMRENESVTNLFTCMLNNFDVVFIRGHKCYATTYTRNYEKSAKENEKDRDINGRQEKWKKAEDIKHKGRNEKYRKRSEMNLFSFHVFFACTCWCMCLCVLYMLYRLKRGHFVSHYIMIQSCHSSGIVGGFCMTITAPTVTTSMKQNVKSGCELQGMHKQRRRRQEDEKKMVDKNKRVLH